MVALEEQLAKWSRLHHQHEMKQNCCIYNYRRLLLFKNTVTHIGQPERTCSARQRNRSQHFLSARCLLVYRILLDGRCKIAKSTYQFVMSVCPPVRPSVCLSVRLSVRLSVCPSVCLSVRPSACLLVRLFVCLSVRPSVYPSVCLSVRLSICLSVPKEQPGSHCNDFN